MPGEVRNINVEAVSEAGTAWKTETITMPGDPPHTPTTPMGVWMSELEPNNTASTANVLASNVIGFRGSVSPGDYDYYRIDLAPGESILIGKRYISDNRCDVPLWYDSTGTGSPFSDPKLSFDYETLPADWVSGGVNSTSATRVTNNGTTATSFYLGDFANFLDTTLCGGTYNYEWWLRRR
jgi:hypothetical protein